MRPFGEREREREREICLLYVDLLFFVFVLEGRVYGIFGVVLINIISTCGVRHPARIVQHELRRWSLIISIIPRNKLLEENHGRKQKGKEAYDGQSLLLIASRSESTTTDCCSVVVVVVVVVVDVVIRSVRCRIETFRIFEKTRTLTFRIERLFPPIYTINTSPADIVEISSTYVPGTKVRWNLGKWNIHINHNTWQCPGFPEPTRLGKLSKPLLYIVIIITWYIAPRRRFPSVSPGTFHGDWCWSPKKKKSTDRIFSHLGQIIIDSYCMMI